MFQCTPESGASYQTSALQVLNRCDFTVTSGSVANGQVIGTEVIAIPATATPGSTIQQTVIWCFGVLSGDGACKAVPSSAPVSGPGAVIKGNQTIGFAPIATHTFGDAPITFTATVMLDVATGQGSISETFNTPQGPVTITVSFVRTGGVYVITGVTGPPS